MYKTLMKKAIFPLLDALNRTKVSAVLASLEQTQWWPQERLLELQRTKLREILSWTRQNSSFYREYWKRAAEERRPASAYPELAGVPIVSKGDLRAHMDRFPVKSHRTRVIKTQTSGSIGEPMTYYRSAEQESWFWALRIRMWEWGGYQLGEPYVTLNLNPRTALRKRIQDVLLRCSYHGFNANRNDVQAVLDDLKGAKHLIGYASSLFLLSRAMRQMGIENPGIQTVLSTGDTLFPTYRSTIEEVFGVGVVDYYGAGGEGFHLASQCEQRHQYHLHIENSVIEILNNGKPARAGEMGEIVVTQLDNHAMPLIRYATEDLAIASGETSCACRRELPLIASIQGRAPDIVFAPDGSALVVHFFTILFEHLSGINQFQIVQDQTDRIIARIVPAEDFKRKSIESQICDAIFAATSGSLAVDFHYTTDIPTSRSNKRRLVISNILPAPFAVNSPLMEDHELDTVRLQPGDSTGQLPSTVAKSAK